MLDPDERKALDDIATFGCHIVQVMAEGDLPPFSYSIGIGQTHGYPEVCVIGLNEAIAAFMINEYNHRLREGETFKTGQLYPGFVENFDVCLEDVSNDHYAAYFGWALWLYKGPEFEMRQMVYPTTAGIYPWFSEAPPSFLAWQPILTKDGKTSFEVRL